MDDRARQNPAHRPAVERAPVRRGPLDSVAANARRSGSFAAPRSLSPGLIRGEWGNRDSLGRIATSTLRSASSFRASPTANPVSVERGPVDRVPAPRRAGFNQRQLRRSDPIGSRPDRIAFWAVVLAVVVLVVAAATAACERAVGRDLDQLGLRGRSPRRARPQPRRLRHGRAHAQLDPQLQAVRDRRRPRRGVRRRDRGCGHQPPGRRRSRRLRRGRRGDTRRPRRLDAPRRRHLVRPRLLRQRDSPAEAS